jgi:hypothetical protein
MTKRSPAVRAAIVIGLSGVINGCISSQDVAVSDPNDVATTEQQVAAPDAAKQRVIALWSDNNWDVYRSPKLERKTYLGKAQRVCSNATSPAECPAGATDYGYNGSDWAARIEACDGKARWIWAPGITGASTPAEMAEYYFVNHVLVPNRPASAQVVVAVDDQAEVIINGKAVGSVGSTSDTNVAWANQSKPTAIDIAGALVTGMNTITVRAANGSGAFTHCTNCTYQQNPAGVVFCVDVRY